MITLIKMLVSWLKLVLARGSRAYIKTKYGPKSDVCIVAGYPGKMIGLYTSQTTKVLRPDQSDHIRRVVGESIFRMYGLPAAGASVPRVVLVITLSAMRVLGFRRAWKLIREWRGDSKVGEVRVIEYSLLPFGKQGTADYSK
jgi:hypothetical protein